MEDVMQFLASRRSIRRYVNKPVPEKLVRQLLEAGRMAPSRGNAQPWRFVVVTDQAIKDELYETAYRQEIVRAAPLLIAILGVIDVRDTVPARTAELVKAGAFATDVKDLADHILDDWTLSELKVDAALNSAIAATHIMLAAHGLGLGCCWVKLCEDDRLLRTLGAADGYYNAGVLTIGYPDESPPARPRLPLTSLVYYGKFGIGAPSATPSHDEPDRETAWHQERRGRRAGPSLSDCTVQEADSYGS
jgi:nitroreductase